MNGRAFYVTDLHGHYAKLMDALDRIEFSPNSGDKLYVAGDLIDRGPNSFEVLSLIENPWFMPVLGNHEHMAIKAMNACFDGPHHIFWCQQGGDWFEKLTFHKRTLVKEYLEYMASNCSHAITSVVNGLSVGVTHSCVSPQLTWSEFSKLKISSDIVINSMNQRHAPGDMSFEDPDVSVVVVGHNPIQSESPVYANGYMYLGNGSVGKASLNILSHFDIQTIVQSSNRSAEVRHELHY